MTMGKMRRKKKQVLVGKMMLSIGRCMTSWRELSMPIIYFTAPEP